MSSKREQRVERRPWTAESERAFTDNAIERGPAACRPALREYAGWLEEERGLGLGSIPVRVASARDLVAAVAQGATTLACLPSITFPHREV